MPEKSPGRLNRIAGHGLNLYQPGHYLTVVLQVDSSQEVHSLCGAEDRQQLVFNTLVLVIEALY